LLLPLSQSGKKVLLYPRQELTVKIYALLISRELGLPESTVLCKVITALKEIEVLYGFPFSEVYHFSPFGKMKIAQEVSKILFPLIHELKKDESLVKQSLDIALHKIKVYF
jgi:hypothetical protein